jgi:peptidyl-tRNA hydrolase
MERQWNPVTRAVQSAFTKGGIDVKVTSTSFRKAAVSKVHTDDPSFSGKLAWHMAHSETTAKKYYFLAEKSKESVETSKKLGKLMREDASETEGKMLVKCKATTKRINIRPKAKKWHGAKKILKKLIRPLRGKLF